MGKSTEVTGGELTKLRWQQVTVRLPEACINKHAHLTISEDPLVMYGGKVSGPA
jgi:hypothetical protein